MARLSPVSLLVLFLIFVIVLLSIDLHGKSSRLVKVVGLEPDETAPDHRQLAAGPNPIALNDKVIYNRIPKTASTAFTHVLYDLAKGIGPSTLFGYISRYNLGCCKLENEILKEAKNAQK